MNNIYNLITHLLSRLGLPRIPMSNLELHNNNVVARLGNNFSVTIPMDRITSICKVSDVNEFKTIQGERWLKLLL